MSATSASVTRHDWSLAEVKALFEQPFNDLLFQAQTVHRQHFDPNRVQVSTLLSIKTGACPEDCKYCPQSGHYNTGLDKEKLMEVQKVLEAAAEAKAIGSTRFCMGAAWKHPSAKDMPYVLKMVEGVKAMGLETCMTLGQASIRSRPRRWRRRGWTTTTTTSTPRRSTTATSSPPAPTASVWRR